MNKGDIKYREYWRIWRRIMRPFRWLRRHFFNRAWLHMLGTVLKAEPWDYAYQLWVEKAGLEYMIDWHKRQGIALYRQWYIRDMQICCGLIDIMSEAERPNLWNPEDHDKLSRPFNMNNAHRFASEDEYQALQQSRCQKALYMEGIYRRKARQLYHKIRADREWEWWD